MPKRQRGRPADRRQLDLTQPEAASDPADQLVQLIVAVEWPELVPGAEPRGYSFRRDGVEKRKADSRIVAFLVPKCLPEKVGFNARAEAGPWWSALFVSCKPALGRDNQDAGGFVSAPLGPFRPA